MHAVREVDLEAPLLAAVDFGGAEARAGRAVFRLAARADGGVADLEVAGLVLLVDRAGHEDVRQTVRLHGRRLDAVRRLPRELGAVQRTQRGGIPLVASRHPSARELPARQPRKARRHHAVGHPEGERRAHVAHALHLLPAARLLQQVEICLADVLPPLQDRLRRRNAALHRDVDALDAQRVEKPRAVADDQAPRAERLRHRIEAALGNHLRPVGDGLAALEVRRHGGRRLEAPEEAEGVDLGARVVERVGVAHHHLRFGDVVDEAPAVGVEVRRPAERVHHLAGGLRAGRHLHKLLDAKRVGLRAHPLQLLLGNQPFREDAAPALGEHDRLRADLLGGQIIRLLPAVLVDPLLARARAHDAPVLLDKRRHGVAGVDLRARLPGTFAEPGRDLRERDDGIALRTHQRRHPRNPERQLRREIAAETLLADLRLAGHRRQLLLREEVAQSARIDDGAGKDVRARRTPLVEHDDARLLPLLRPTQQGKGRREARRTRPHDQHIGFDHFSSSLISAGTISKRSPTMPRSATPKIGAWGSALTATTTSAPRMPSRCWMAPEMPKHR